MNPTELYVAGRLAEAVDAQAAEVEAHPADRGRRMFLFELLAFAGELEPARRQVEAAHHGDPELDLATLGYRKLVDSEMARRRFFQDGVPPKILGETTEAIRLRVEAVALLRDGQAAGARERLDRALELSPPCRGRLNGRPFGSIRDGDARFGAVLEVMAQGEYFWIGLEQVEALAMDPPRQPRDLIYVPARLDLGGRSGEVFLPVLYPDTHKQADDRVRLGRVTEWPGGGDDEGPTLGVGSRVFLVDDQPVGLLEWRAYIRDGPSLA